MDYKSGVKVKFYLLGSGRSPVEEFIQDQSTDIQADFVDAVNLLEAGKILSMPFSRNLARLHAGLHELRLKDRSGQVRVFYFIKNTDGIYMLHAFRKKTRELPKKEVEIALRRIREV